MTGFRSYLKSGTQYDFTWQATRLYRRDASNRTNDWTLVYTGSAAITDIDYFDGKLLIAMPLHGSADFAIQTDISAAATWTPTTYDHAAFSAGLGKPSFFRSIRGWSYAFVNPNKVFYSSDPTTDGWVGPIDTSLTGNYSGPAGDDGYNFKGALAANDYLFCFKDDAGYNIDSQQEVTEVLWHFKSRPSADNYKYVCTGSDFIYYSVSPEVYAYDPTSGRNVPLGLASQTGFSTEQIKGLAADNQFIYVLAQVRVPTIRSASSMVLFRGWRVGAMKWAFDVPWEDTAATTYTGLGCASTSTYGTRIYIFPDAGTSTLLLDMAPAFDQSLTTTAFAASGTLYPSLWRTSYPTLSKRWLYTAIRTSGVDATETVDLAYSTDQGANFTSNFTTTTAGLRTDNLSNINGEVMALRFTLAGDGTATPVLNVYAIHARPRWRSLESVKLDIRIANGISRNNGAYAESDTQAAIVTALRALRTTDSSITYEDFLGNSFTVAVDSLGFRPTRHYAPEKSGTGVIEMEAGLLLTRADKGT
jgi:hypothetical protein